MVPPGGRVYKIHTKQADTSWLFVSFLSLFLIQVWSNYNVVLITAIHKVTRLCPFSCPFPSWFIQDTE